MTDQPRIPDDVNEKANISKVPAIADDDWKQDTIVVVDEEEKAILKKIDLQ
jgi:hypothetical protein